MAGSAVSEMKASPDWIGRYLHLLDVDDPKPDLETLGRLVRAHLSTVPFENVTSILRRRAHLGQPVPPLDPKTLLTAWEQKRGGGLCYEEADTFGRLLVALGFRARVVLGFITFLGSHHAVLVEVDGRRYLVDVGNGAPFFEPIPLDRPFEVRRAGLAYRFRPGDAAEMWLQDRWIDDAWAPFCRYELGPTDPSQRQAAFQRHHTPGDGWVVGRLTLARCTENEVYRLRDQEFTRFTAEGKHTEQVTQPEDRARLVADVFGLPGLPVEEAVQALADLQTVSPHEPQGCTTAVAVSQPA